MAIKPNSQKRKSGTSGSVSIDPEGDIKQYSLNDIAYLLSRPEKIDRTLILLTNIYVFLNNTGHYKTLKELCEAQNISYHIIGILKRNNVFNTDAWLWRSGQAPTKTLAIQAQLWYREYFANKKAKPNRPK